MPVVPAAGTTTAFSTYFDAGTCSYTVETQTTPVAGFAMATSTTSGTTGTTQALTGTTSENNTVSAVQVDTMDVLFNALGEEYAQYIEDFITNMQIVFPKMKNDWGIYMPEVKYLSPEPPDP